MIEIRRLTPETAPLLWTVEDRRLDSERVIVRPRVGGFDLDYKPLPGALWRVGNVEREMPEGSAHWLSSGDHDVYFGWLDDSLAGQLVLEVGENNLACIRDVRVAMQVRRRGVGEALLDMAEDWARSKQLGGLLAETQDVNAGACQFLTRCGFQLGGVDALRYVARSKSTLMAVGLRETALFFYKFFR
ncbi:GNAT family N-acetyltransferase [Eubacteriales bacterium OttesenSCG-928-A19]|nr:GNAT family N-acetyltransferase [Eubacteriales bacterium OttesenSCG-928-A19]